MITITGDCNLTQAGEKQIASKYSHSLRKIIPKNSDRCLKLNMSFGFISKSLGLSPKDCEAVRRNTQDPLSEGYRFWC